MEQQPQYYENLINTKICLDMEKNGYSYKQNLGKRRQKWQDKKKAKFAKEAVATDKEEEKKEENEDKPIVIPKVLPAVEEILRKT